MARRELESAIAVLVRDLGSAAPERKPGSSLDAWHDSLLEVWLERETA